MLYSNKPWGHETLIYHNKDFAIWHLVIKSKQQTSMHSHPNKTTGLLILDGYAELSFINQSHILEKLDKKIIRKGVFHQTKNVGDQDLHLLEVECPNNKSDILRLEDNYGRACTPYENDYLDLLPEINLNLYKTLFHKIKIEQLTINHQDELQKECPLILKRGEIYEQHIKVLVPGDMTDTKTFKLLANKFTCDFPIEVFLFYVT